MGRTAIIEEKIIKDIFDKKNKTKESHIILVDLEKIEKVLNSLNTDSFKREIYPDYFTDDNSEKETKKLVKESHLKKLISIFGEKNYPLSRRSFNRAISYLLAHNKCKNGKKIKQMLIKLLSLKENLKSNIGSFEISSSCEKEKFFGFLTKEEIEENFMKLLEELTDLHESFNLEKTGNKSPELTFKLLDYIDEEEWQYHDLREIAGHFEEIIKNLFYSIRRAHQYQLDLVVMEEEPW